MVVHTNDYLKEKIKQHITQIQHFSPMERKVGVLEDITYQKSLMCSHFYPTPRLEKDKINRANVSSSNDVTLLYIVKQQNIVAAKNK